MGLQDPTAKMSKSTTNLNDVIFLSDTPDEICQKLKKAVTDSENCVKYDKENKPGVSNLMTIYGLLEEKSMEDVEKEFEGKGYGEFKKTTAEAIVKKLQPLNGKYQELLQNPEQLRKIYEKGAEKARQRAKKNVDEVYRKVGLIVNE